MPVINPWLFCVIELLGNLKFAAGVVCFISVILLVAALFIYGMETDDCYPNESLLKGCKKNIKDFNNSFDYFIYNVYSNPIKRYDVQNVGC